MQYVSTTRGMIPIDDYYEIQAMQYGFDSYQDLRNEGLSIYVDPESVVDVEDDKSLDF